MKNYIVKIIPQTYIFKVKAKSIKHAKSLAEEAFRDGDYEDDSEGGETIIVNTTNTKEKKLNNF